MLYSSRVYKMKPRLFFVCTAFMALIVTTASTQTKLASSTPRLEKRGAVTHLIVDGKPWLSLAGELGNNTASTVENVRPYW